MTLILAVLARVVFFKCHVTPSFCTCSLQINMLLNNTSHILKSINMHFVGTAPYKLWLVLSENAEEFKERKKE